MPLCELCDLLCVLRGKKLTTEGAEVYTEEHKENINLTEFVQV